MTPLGKELKSSDAFSKNKALCFCCSQPLNDGCEIIQQANGNAVHIPVIVSKFRNAVHGILAQLFIAFEIGACDLCNLLQRIELVFKDQFF